MPDITLYEFGPTRSARVRWVLLETGLEYRSIGNSPDIIHSDEVRAINPLGKLPAIVIDGKPLFESAAIVAALADLVPEKNLIARPGTWARALHDQWVSFALTEMECWLWSTELNATDLILPAEERMPEIAAFNTRMFLKSAAALDRVLGDSDYLVEDRFTATDIIVGYTVCWAGNDGFLGDFQNLRRYLDRLLEREHCTLQPVA